jgi:isoaspartyl peptidase/L-asparaginase-like protein (Ntn-hydrolase superfamily)
MEAIRELERIRERLGGQLRVLQSELDAVNKAIQLLQREQASAGTPAEAQRFAKAGLAESIRQVVGTVFTVPRQIRNRMLEGGYRAPSKAKLLNAVYATCKRLAEKGEFEAGKVDGKLAFRKKGQPEERTPPMV